MAAFTIGRLSRKPGSSTQVRKQCVSSFLTSSLALISAHQLLLPRSPASQLALFLTSHFLYNILALLLTPQLCDTHQAGHASPQPDKLAMK